MAWPDPQPARRTIPGVGNPERERGAYGAGGPVAYDRAPSPPQGLAPSPPAPRALVTTEPPPPAPPAPAPRHMAPSRGGRDDGPGDDDGEGGGGGGGGGGGAGGRRSRWLLPALLALACGGFGGLAVLLDQDEEPTAVGDGAAVTTPVLSARRVPEVLAEPVAERRLDADLDAWLTSSPTDTCLVVEDAGSAVYQHNPTTPLTGASTQKLVTATALLMALGPDATLDTTAVAAAAPSGGVVAGDLFIVGGGDAALAQQSWLDSYPGRSPRVIHDVEALADAIADAGVTRIDGSVVGDGSRYDDQRYNPAIAPRLIEQDQVGPVGGLMVNDGFARFDTGRTAAGTVPAADPAADAARVVTDLLRARGITVAGAPRAGTAPAGATEVAGISSPPMSQVVGEMLSHSDNDTAEAAIKEVGRAEAGKGSSGAGAEAITRLLTEGDVPMDGVRVVDGSGLSIDDRLTCAMLVDLLTRPETGPVVRDGLAVAGETGTLSRSWAGTPAAGHLRAKTGTLRNVTALAGEIDAADGGTVTFAYVANVPDPQEVTSAGVGMVGLADILMGYPEGVDIAQLLPAPPTGLTAGASPDGTTTVPGATATDASAGTADDAPSGASSPRAGTPAAGSPGAAATPASG